MSYKKTTFNDVLESDSRNDGCLIPSLFVIIIILIWGTVRIIEILNK